MFGAAALMGVYMQITSDAVHLFLLFLALAPLLMVRQNKNGTCDICGQKVPYSLQVCPSCGADLALEERISKKEEKKSLGTKLAAAYAKYDLPEDEKKDSLNVLDNEDKTGDYEEKHPPLPSDELESGLRKEFKDLFESGEDFLDVLKEMADDDSAADIIKASEALFEVEDAEDGRDDYWKSVKEIAGIDSLSGLEPEMEGWRKPGRKGTHDTITEGANDSEKEAKPEKKARRKVKKKTHPKKTQTRPELASATDRENAVKLMQNFLKMAKEAQAKGDGPKPDVEKEEKNPDEPSRDEVIQSLMLLPGVGGIRARRLYDEGFRTYDSIRDTAPDELARITGMGLSQAEKIHASLKKDDSADEKRDLYLCPSCGAFIGQDAEGCPVCGAAFEEEGEEAEDDDIFQDAHEGALPPSDEEIPPQMPESEMVEDSDGFWYKERGSLFMCPVCGSFVTEGTEECPSCGAILEDDDEELAEAFEDEPSDEPEAEAAPEPEDLDGYWYKREASLALCPSCGAFLSRDSTECGVCGKMVDPDELATIEETKPTPDMFGEGGFMCEACGAYYEDTLDTCTVCGILGEVHPVIRAKTEKGYDYWYREDESLLVCPNCNNFIVGQAENCSNCGEALDVSKLHPRKHAATAPTPLTLETARKAESVEDGGPRDFLDALEEGHFPKPRKFIESEETERLQRGPRKHLRPDLWADKPESAEEAPEDWEEPGVEPEAVEEILPPDDITFTEPARPAAVEVPEAEEIALKEVEPEVPSPEPEAEIPPPEEVTFPEPWEVEDARLFAEDVEEIPPPEDFREFPEPLEGEEEPEEIPPPELPVEAEGSVLPEPSLEFEDIPAPLGPSEDLESFLEEAEEKAKPSRPRDGRQVIEEIPPELLEELIGRPTWDRKADAEPVEERLAQPEIDEDEDIFAGFDEILELEKAIDRASPAPPEPSVECSACGLQVGMSDPSCPGCGARFAKEEPPIARETHTPEKIDLLAEADAAGPEPDFASTLEAEETEPSEMEAPAKLPAPILPRPRPRIKPKRKQKARPLERGLVNGHGLVNGKGRVNGLTNGLVNGKGAVNGKGLVNGLTNGLVNGKGRVNGLTNGLVNGKGAVNGKGLVNGLTNGLVNGKGAVNGKGLVNGLINGNGLVNGRGRLYKSRRISKRTEMGKSIVAVIILLILIIASPLLISPFLERTQELRVDGVLDDWPFLLQYPDRLDDQKESSINLQSFGVLSRGTNIYFFANVTGSILKGGHGVDTLNIFLDTDGDLDTGYSIKTIGADAMIEVSGWNGKIASSKLYRFSPERSNQDWNGFTYSVHVNTAARGGTIEAGLYGIHLGNADRQSLDRVKVLFRTANNEGGQEDFSDIFVSSRPGVLSITQASVASELLQHGAMQPVLRLDMHAFKRDASIGAINITKRGTDTSISSVGLYADTDRDGYFGSADEFLGNYPIQGGKVALELVEPLLVPGGENRSYFLVVEVPPGAIPETSFGLWVEEGSDVPTLQKAPISLQSQGLYSSYLLAPPDRIVVDGAFADWFAYTPLLDRQGDAPNPNTDLMEFQMAPTDGSLAFYMAVDGEMLGGMDVPLINRRPVLPEGTGDSDGDSVPDWQDPMPFDFDNNGTPDLDEGGDIDGDGLLDFPEGDDVWLNTTIPAEFPPPFGGRNISIFIGGPLPDSDRDGIPDRDETGFENDFDNDGEIDFWLDEENGTDLDGDGDGVVDYPEGPDIWLDGILTTVYIGPPASILPPELPTREGFDVSRVFLDTDNDPYTGYRVLSGFGADAMISISGRQGRVVRSTGSEFAGNSSLEWSWKNSGDIDAMVDSKRLEAAANWSLLGIDAGSEYRALFFSTDWDLDSQDFSDLLLDNAQARSVKDFRLRSNPYTFDLTDGRVQAWNLIPSAPGGEGSVTDVSKDSTCGGKGSDILETKVADDSTYLYFYMATGQLLNNPVHFYLDMDQSGSITAGDFDLVFDPATGTVSLYQFDGVSWNAIVLPAADRYDQNAGKLELGIEKSFLGIVDIGWPLSYTTSVEQDTAPGGAFCDSAGPSGTYVPIPEFSIAALPLIVMFIPYVFHRRKARRQKKWMRNVVS